MMEEWRPKNWNNPYQDTGFDEELNIYEAGANAMLEALKPLIKKIAPSSKLMDILEI